MNPNPTPRASFDFVRFTIAMILVFARNVISMMTDNTNYLLPFPTLVDVTVATDKLASTNEAALTGGKIAIAERKAAKKDLLALLRQLASWVQAHCQQDRVILLSSGFNTTRVPALVGQVKPPKTPIVRQGDVSGKINARVGKVTGAYAYNWRVALASAPTVYVQTMQTTGGRAFFTGLTPGQVYLVQANALGSTGPSDWSSAGTLMVI